MSTAPEQNVSLFLSPPPKLYCRGPWGARNCCRFATLLCSESTKDQRVHRRVVHIWIFQGEAGVSHNLIKSYKKNTAEAHQFWICSKNRQKKKKNVGDATQVFLDFRCASCKSKVSTPFTLATTAVRNTWYLTGVVWTIYDFDEAGPSRKCYWKQYWN